MPSNYELARDITEPETIEDFLVLLNDFRHGWEDQPDKHLSPGDYEISRVDQAGRELFTRRSRNKRRAAWFTGVAGFAELAAEKFVVDPLIKQEISDRDDKLIDVTLAEHNQGQPMTEADVAAGDALLDLAIGALQIAST